MGIRPVSNTLRSALVNDSWVLVASDLHLAANTTSASLAVERELSRAISEGSKHHQGIIVLNGDIIEMWAGERPSVVKALKAHPKLTRAIADFAKLPDHKVFYVIGNHDGKLGWDKKSQKDVASYLSAKLCFTLELISPQGSIRFEHGHRFDPDNSFEDPRDPYDKPFGQYLVQQALPLVKESQGKLLAGIDHLAEPHQFPKFVVSRVMYREIVNRSWWLLIPIIITLIGRIVVGLGIYQVSGIDSKHILEIIILTELAVFINVALIVLVLVLILQNILKRAKGIPGQGAGIHHNDPPRDEAKLQIHKGNLGVITGHTHRPELTKIEHGFYANSGCGTKMIMASKAKFGLPKTYIAKNQLSWLELTFADNLDINLYSGSTVVGEQTRLERALTKKRHSEQPIGLQKHLRIEL